MSLNIVIRGNTVELTSVFTDADGGPLNPSSAVAVVNFKNAGGDRESETVPMSEQSDGAWLGLWNSSNARPGRVYWSVRAENPSAAEDGQFDLRANLANLEID